MAVISWYSSCVLIKLFDADAPPVVHEETGPSEANLFSGMCIADPKQASAKQVNPITQLQKILRFRLLREGENDDEKVKATGT